MADNRQSDPDLEPKAENIKDIPPEVWEIIFLQLTSAQLLLVRLVCRQWRDIVLSSPKLMDRFVVNFPRDTVMTHDYIPKYLIPGTSRACIAHLKIDEIPAWWTQFGQKLVQMKIFNLNISFTKFVELLQRTPNLKKLVLINSVVLFDCETLNCKLDKLEELDINSHHNPNKQTKFSLFGPVCPNLKALEITLNYDTKPAEENDAIQLVKAVQKTLESLTLHSSALFFAQLRLMKELRLKQLMSYSPQEPLQHVMEFIREQPSIEYLVPCHDLSDRDLQQIAIYLPNLKTLSTQLVPYGQRATFLRTMTKLKRLRLSIDMQDIDLLDCSNDGLEKLWLRFVILSNGTLPQFLLGCRNLRFVTLENCLDIQDWTDVFNALATLPRLRTLRILFLQIVLQTDYTANGPVDELVHLKQLYCTMSKPMMTALFAKCPQLRTAWLSGKDVDDEVVLQLCQQAKKLEFLSITNASLITDAVADFIVEHGTVLRELRVIDCSTVTNAVKEKLSSIERIGVTVRLKNLRKT